MEKNDIYIYIPDYLKREQAQDVLRAAGENIDWLEAEHVCFPAHVFYYSNYITFSPTMNTWNWTSRDWLNLLQKTKSITIEELEQLLKQK